MSGNQHDDASAGKRVGLIFNVVVTLLDVGVAIAAFRLARSAGASEAAAYFIGSVGPLLGSLAVWLRARELSGASLAILVFTVLSAVAAVAGSHNPDVLLYKDAVATGLVGVIFAGSLLFPRPLAFYFGQRYATDGTHDGMERWNRLWRYSLFRRAQYLITAVWAAVYVLEALGKAYIIHSAGFTAAYTWTQILPFAAAGIVVTLTIAKHYYAADDRSTADPAGADRVAGPGQSPS